MAKRLFLLLISAFMGIFATPEVLMASDTVDVQGIDNARIVETVPIVEEPTSTEPVIENVVVARQSAYVAPARETYVAPASTPAYVAPSNNISIAGRTLEIVDVANTTVDSGGHVNKYGSKFLYGHNSAAVFGGLTGLGVGSGFSVTYGGVTTNYIVSKIVIYEKNVETGKLQLNGAGSYMRAVADAKSDGVYYDLSIMTCYGISYGNGDASHRWVIFANAV